MVARRNHRMTEGTEKIIILMSPLQEIPIELEKEIIVLDFPLPNLSKLNQLRSHQLEKTKTR